MSFYVAKTQYYDEDGRFITERRLTAANNFQDAFAIIIDYYGEDAIESITLELVGVDSSVELFDDEFVKGGRM